MNWEIFQKYSLKVHLKTITDIDEALNLFTSNIQTLAWKSTLPSQSSKSTVALAVYGKEQNTRLTYFTTTMIK